MSDERERHASLASETHDRSFSEFAAREDYARRFKKVITHNIIADLIAIVEDGIVAQSDGKLIFIPYAGNHTIRFVE